MPPALSQLPAKPASWPDTAAAAKAGADAAVAGGDVADGGDAAGGGGEVSRELGLAGLGPGGPGTGQSLRFPPHLPCLSRVLPPPPHVHHEV